MYLSLESFLVIFFVNAGEESCSSSLCTPSAAPIRCHLRVHSSCRSHRPASAAATERPYLLLFLLHGWNGSVDGLLLRARSWSQKIAATTLQRRNNTEEISQPATPLWPSTRAHTALWSCGALGECHIRISLAFKIDWRGGRPWSGAVVSELSWFRQRKWRLIAFLGPARWPLCDGYQCAHVDWFSWELVQSP